MLIRKTIDDRFECITQEQHAFASGLLAAAWQRTRLDPHLVQVIGVHDTPWRRADQGLLFDEATGLPHDFITYPMDQKVHMYSEGLDEIEEIDPLAAYLVSLHYTTFSGTRDHEPLTRPEQARRERLERFVGDDVDVDDALGWIKFFDILSLYLCLTGPRAEPGSIPRWLDGDGWQTSPDGAELALEWRDDRTLSLQAWPFVEDELRVPLRMRVFDSRFSNASDMRRAWSACEPTQRSLLLQPGH